MKKLIIGGSMIALAWPIALHAITVEVVLPPMTIVGYAEPAMEYTLYAIYENWLPSESPASDPVTGAAIVKNTFSTDVRCNPLASEITRNIKSTDDQVAKFGAAQQLFRAISGQMGAAGIGKVIAGLPLGNRDGTMAPVWTTTWSDGSSSSFFVLPGLYPQFLEQGPPDGEKPPTGQTSCPVTA